MERTLPNNEMLSRQFFDVMIRTSTEHGQITMAMKHIVACPRSIAEAFVRDGDLSKCRVPKLWKQWYPVLEDILRNGTEVTAKAVVAKDIAEQSAKKHCGPDGMTRRIAPTETRGSWDNGIRNMER